jgi:predicted lipoprotein with Yx(FWY)xxD motif
MRTKTFAILSSLAFTVLSPVAADAASMLTAKNGQTLYTFDKDSGGASACYQDCAKKWPPYEAKAGEKMGEGWTVVKRKDGQSQWAYDGKPMYFYADDKNKGDALGDGKGGVWHVVKE